MKRTTKPKLTDYTILIQRIMDAIYFGRLLPNQIYHLSKLLMEYDGGVERNLANSICEYLNIEKRQNRSAIELVISNYKIENHGWKK
jgi:hypothetical protein